ncbi:unnamed protein product [Leptidea sinapis]|uniref:Uncharacterized protein n=1 Tax=Leptidea sinapis TaxID=189913 RepID=A0A5E4Q9H9_9NEOP|nr:unnamed protein product [Leptidea sinapis]
MFGEKAIVYLSIISLASCSWYPATKQLPKNNSPLFIRNEITKNSKIPNKEFCDFMQMNGAGTYLVLPWWKEYCQLSDDDDVHLFEIFYKPMYSAIVDQIQSFRKRGIFEPGMIQKEPDYYKI